MLVIYMKRKMVWRKVRRFGKNVFPILGSVAIRRRGTL